MPPPQAQHIVVGIAVTHLYMVQCVGSVRKWSQLDGGSDVQRTSAENCRKPTHSLVMGLTEYELPVATPGGLSSQQLDAMDRQATRAGSARLPPPAS